MFFDQEVFLGVDPGGGRSQMLWAAINLQGEILTLREGSLDEVVTFARSIPKVVVCINSSAGVSQQLMQVPDVRNTLLPRPKPGKYLQYRVCEYLLKSRNIRLIPTPVKEETAPDWMKRGFRLFFDLRLIEAIQLLETNAHAAFCCLLGKIPFLKQTSEGQIQRQLALLQAGLVLRDPMQYYEEITRRKLLQGILPAGQLYSCRELDALISAFTARQAIHNPDETLLVGDPREGQITLPVRSLKDRYH